MAAGKLDGYLSNEFRDRESIVSKRDYYYSKNEYYHGQRGYERKKEVGGRDMYEVRKKDNSRKREELYYTSLSVKSGSNGSGRYDNKKGDRESGELSSETGSDGSVSGVEVPLPLRKKPKFSPIVWVEEKKKESCKFKNGVIPIVCSHQSPKVVLVDEVQISPILVDTTRSHGESPIMDLSSSLHQGHGSTNPEAERPEEEEFGSERSISASRWADDDVGEILDNDEMNTREKSMPTSGSSTTSLSSRVLSPEFGEFVSGSACGSDCHVKDYLELDLDKENNNITFDGSDTDSEGEDDYRGTPELTGSQQRNINMLHSCSRSVHEFERLNKIGSGTYGDVYRARDTRNGEIVALKKVKMDKEREGFPLTSLREINILLSLNHPSIVDVKEVVIEEDVKKGKCETYLVMEYMEHDLKGLMESMKQPFSQSEVKCLMLQLFEGVKCLHDNWVLHRDLKTSNLLLNNRGELKICDFGLSRQYGSPLKPYTPLVVTLWYRAPELLLEAKQYSTAIDMWSLGCIMAELLAKEPLFSADTEIRQLHKIFQTLGTPNETIWPGFSTLPGSKVNFLKHKSSLRQKFPPTSFTGSPFLSAAGFDLLSRLLTFDPEKRITAQDAVNHEWFREVPLPKAKEFMPTYPPQYAKARY